MKKLFGALLISALTLIVSANTTLAGSFYYTAATTYDGTYQAIVLYDAAADSIDVKCQTSLQCGSSEANWTTYTDIFPGELSYIWDKFEISPSPNGGNKILIPRWYNDGAKNNWLFVEEFDCDDGSITATEPLDQVITEVPDTFTMSKELNSSNEFAFTYYGQSSGDLHVAWGDGSGSFTDVNLTSTLGVDSVENTCETTTYSPLDIRWGGVGDEDLYITFFSDGVSKVNNAIMKQVQYDTGTGLVSSTTTIKDWGAADKCAEDIVSYEIFNDRASIVSQGDLGGGLLSTRGYYYDTSVFQEVVYNTDLDGDIDAWIDPDNGANVKVLSGGDAGISLKEITYAISTGAVQQSVTIDSDTSPATDVNIAGVNASGLLFGNYTRVDTGTEEILFITEESAGGGSYNTCEMNPLGGAPIVPVPEFGSKLAAVLVGASAIGLFGLIVMFRGKRGGAKKKRKK